MSKLMKPYLSAGREGEGKGKGGRYSGGGALVVDLLVVVHLG